MRTSNWVLEVQTPLLTAVEVFPGSLESLPVPALQYHWCWGLPQLHMHVCEAGKLVWKLLLSFSKVHFPCSFPGPSNLGLLALPSD